MNMEPNADIVANSIISGEFYQHVEKSKEYYNNIIEYEMDEEDYIWLPSANEKRTRRGEKQLEADDLCAFMDYLEKNTYFEAAAVSPSDDDVCCVCLNGEPDEENIIIYCDLCGMIVHQKCYGVQYLKVEDDWQWLCRKCLLSPSARITCQLCPSQTGAMKQAEDGEWVHVICAQVHPEVDILNPDFLEPIEGIKRCLESRVGTECLVCGKASGACVKCSIRKCNNSSHATCAVLAGLIDPMKKSSSFCCPLHSIKRKENFEDRKAEIDQKILEARESIQNETQFIRFPFLPKDAVDSITSRVGMPIRDVVHYWIFKRRINKGKHLIRRLQTKPIVCQDGKEMSTV